MNDFKSYSKNQQGKNTGGNNGNNVNNDGAGNARSVEQTANMAAMLAKAFNGKSEGQIWQTILAQAEQGKREGTLTNADLDNFYSTVAPMLDGFKRQKLKSVIAKLKSI